MSLHVLYLYSVSILCDPMARDRCATRKIKKLGSYPVDPNQAHLGLWFAEHSI